MLGCMSDKTQQSPTVPVYNKALRKWTFYIFPEGVEQEAGDFPDEESCPGGILEDLSHLAG